MRDPANDVATAMTVGLSPGRAGMFPLALDRPGGDPSQIGRYQVVERLGRGGMGVVYAALDPELGRKVAIKLIYADDVDLERLRRRQDLLLREAQALARLSHPNIVAIHDVGVHDGQVFVAMEFVAGRTMRQWWDERRPGWQEVVAAMVQAGRGIVAAHAAGLVHRDIKPDNLLIGDDGRVRVADFGLARFDAAAGEPSTLASGLRERPAAAGPSALVGTPMYMPPEQHEGDDVGPYSDQFSFCVTLWEGLYGRRPFVGAPNALPSLVRAGPPPRPSSAPDLPAWLERAVRRGLAARPGDRWPSMQALLDVLALDLDARRARRRGRALSAALVTVGCVALLLGGRALQSSRARAAAEQAAAGRLIGVGASVAQLLTTGRRAEAEATLRAFVEEPELRDTRAAIDAWLMWADHMDALNDPAAAQAAVVEAYTALPADDPREPAIALRIARHFRAAWNFAALAALGDQVVARWPELARASQWAELRADAALARGDLPGFLAVVDDAAAGPEREAIAPAVRALATARCPVRGDMRAFTIDWPGSDGPEVVVYEGARPRETPSIRRMDPALTPVGPDLADIGYWFEHVHARPHVLAAGGPAYLVAWAQQPIKETSLVELGAGAPRELLRWSDDAPNAAAVADLDGDGRSELYIGTGTYTRRFYRLEPDARGVWQRRPAHPPTDAIHSDINALVPGDFDGDGRTELAAAVGAWRAYDVRIFEAGPDGELRVALRQRFGHVRQLAALKAADGGTLLALAKDDSALSKEAWPAGAPQGEAAGLHIVRRRGDALAPVAYFPWPQPDDAPAQRALVLSVGDFDGDGLQDLVAGLAVESQQARGTLLVRQGPDGGFTAARLGAIYPHLAGDFDGDPADELLATIRRGDVSELCVLGVDGEPVAPNDARPAAAGPPALAEPLLANAWSRAEHLAGFGLYGDAALALDRRALLVDDIAERRALQRRTAELYEAAGEFGRAGERYEALALAGDRAAALRAVANFEQGLQMADALRVARSALRGEGLTPVQASELRAADERLTAIEGRQARLDLRFDGSLSPAWQIHQPLALRVDPVRGELLVDATSDMDAIATLPVELTGEPLTLELDLDVERADWGTRFGVALLPVDGGEPAADLSIGAGGGGGYLRRADTVSPYFDFAGWETASATERSEHRMRLDVLSGHGRLHMQETGDHPGERIGLLPRTIRPGRYTLTIQSLASADLATQQVRARLRRIALIGGRLAADGAAVEPRARIAHDLASGRWHAALTALEGDTSPQGRLWRGVALAELGRTDDAVAAFAAVDPTEPELRRQLRHLLRTRHATFGLLLRAALGPRYAALLLESLTKTAEHDDDELQALRLGATADLEGLPGDDSPQSRRTRADLLALRGAARRSVRALAAAADDLTTAAALREELLAEQGEARDAELATLELRRAEVDAQLGRPDAALAAVERALRRATDPEWMAERLRISQALAPVRADPRWRALLAASP